MYNCGIEPNYFLDEMTPTEVESLSNAYYEHHKEKWEMLRLSNHAIVSSQSSKPIKVTDIMSFPWDDKEIKKQQKVSEEDIERMKKKLNLI